MAIDTPTLKSETATAGSVVDASRRAQQVWSDQPVTERLRVVRAVRRSLVDDAREWAGEITVPGRRSLADSLAAEVLPTADACRFLERNAAKILRETKPSRRDRPLWGSGLKVRIRREPRGAVLVIGAWNYPLMLAGVQTLQAIAAGNAVLVKPAPGCSAPMRRLSQVIEQAGAPRELFTVLDESPEAAQQAMREGVDHVVLTGSAATGRAVMRQAAETLTPCTMELSGCDAVFVLPGADLDRVAAAVAFGLRLNGSCTCIGPRRIFVPEQSRFDLMEKIALQVRHVPPTSLPKEVAALTERLVKNAIQGGGESLFAPTFEAENFSPILLDAPPADAELLRTDLFAPIVSLIPVTDPEQALELSRACPYALGASVFGPTEKAEPFADQVEAGCVTVNDLIAPTADPRIPFGGRRQSGFGVTRGAEGLLEMTRPKAIVTQTARWLPHLDPPRPELDRLLIGLLRMAHGGSLAERWRGLKEIISASRGK